VSIRNELRPVESVTERQIESPVCRLDFASREPENPRTRGSTTKQCDTLQVLPSFVFRGLHGKLLGMACHFAW
jgi:hypothetical protein